MVFGVWTSDSYAFYPAANYMFKVNHGNTRRRCEICSKLTIKTSERRQWGGSGAFIFNFEHISHLVLVFLLLTLSRQMPAGLRIFQANIHLFKVSNRNTRKRCKTHWKDTRTTLLKSFRCLCNLWTFSKPFSSVSVVDFEQVNTCWKKFD